MPADVATNVFERYGPPFDLTSDMLLAMALCPAAPLRDTFPAVPFLSVAGRTPLVMWFSRIRKVLYYREGDQYQLGSNNEVLYCELNIAALVWQRAFFVPQIYVNSELTRAIRHHYGMPKVPGAIELEVDRSHFSAWVTSNASRSVIRARLLGQADYLSTLTSRFWPRYLWPTRFPDGRWLRPLVQATPYIQFAWLERGQLDLNTSWLPELVTLLSPALYLADQRMQLPPP